MVNTLHWLEHVRYGFDNLKVVISMWKTSVNALVEHKSAKTSNCRSYWMMSQLKLNSNWQKHQMCYKKQSGDVYEQWGRSINSVNGSHTIWMNVSHTKTSERHLEIAWMGHPSASAVLPRPGAIWLSPLRINGPRARRAALQQFRGSWQMAQRMVSHKIK